MTKQPASLPIRMGVFSDVESADKAVHGLLEAGFTVEEITVICSDQEKERHFKQYEHQEPAGTFTPETALTGGAIGLLLGGLTAIPLAVASGGVGLIVAGGAAWTGGVFGTLVGAMMARGVERELANYYEQAVTEGKILVAAEDSRSVSEIPGLSSDADAQRMAKAEQVLCDAGAEPLRLPEG